MIERRTFVQAAALAGMVGPAAWARAARAMLQDGATCRFGLVTYLWGQHLSLAELIAACEATNLEGVELRTTHRHGVERLLDGKARQQTLERFADSPVTLVGIGSNERFDSPDPARLAAAMTATRQFLDLSADIGASGVKVKPDSFHRGVEREATLDQIGRSLRELGPYAADRGQEIRLEVHGQCADPKLIAEIIERADHPTVKVCWNSNPTDLGGGGFLENYRLLRPHFGRTLHCRRLDTNAYPFMDLLELLAKDNYDGYVLLEAHSQPPRHLRSALGNQRALFDRYREDSKSVVSSSQGSVSIAPGRWNRKHLEVTIDGEPFATCRTGNENPCLYPLYAPGQRLVVRGFPMGHRDGEATDHPHHRACFFAHGDVDGHDFWHGKACRIRVREHRIDGDTLHFTADWMGPDGKVATENRSMRFSGDGRNRRVEFDITLIPEGERMVMGDTKEGAFALRVAPSLRQQGGQARGRIENAEGLQGDSCWGRRSPWVLYEGPVGGRLVRLRITDHPDNPRHPTWWHARNYGLFAANPFGRSDFERGAAKMPLEVTREDPLRLRYTLDLETGLPRA
ncbi:MAG: PmoA family protein [Phycisphaerales bacterium]|nr:PmoA family protein [Phycisphaerales bacterium]